MGKKASVMRRRYRPLPKRVAKVIAAQLGLRPALLRSKLYVLSDSARCVFCIGARAAHLSQNGRLKVIRAGAVVLRKMRGRDAWALTVQGKATPWLNSSAL